MQLRHIATTLSGHERLLREGLYRALLAAALDGEELAGRPARVLDVGCGRGELMSLLDARGHTAVGLDPEAECVRLSSAFGQCLQGTLEDAPRLFDGAEFDVVVCSHVLEHLENPVCALAALRALRAGRYVIAVPNVLRAARLARAVAGSSKGDHPAHLYGWGKPELAALARCGGFEVVRWNCDRVTVNPLRGRLGAMAARLLAPLEVRLLPRLFPGLSSSLIVSCRLSGSAGYGIRSTL